MKKLSLNQAQCSFFALFILLILLITSTGVSHSHVITIDGCHILSMVSDTPDDKTAYLYDAVRNNVAYFNLITETIGPIEEFRWTRDVGDTYDAVKELSEELERLSKECIEQNKPLVILSHSWGTVLAYLALKEKPNIHVNKLITMGSPLDAIDLIVWQLTHNYVQDNAYFDHYGFPYVNEWKNYWAIFDLISGPISGASNTHIKSLLFFDPEPISRALLSHGAYYIDPTVWNDILSDVVNTKTVTLNGPSAVKVLDTVTYFSNNDLNGVPIIKWEWDLDYNGSTFNPDPNYTNRQISYTFRQFRNRTVAVRVTDTNGKQTVASQYIQVSQYPFHVSGAWNSLTQSFFFDDPFPSSLISSCSWNFGDGSPANTEWSPDHTYPNPGVYKVILTLTLDDNSTIQSNQDVWIGSRTPSYIPIPGHTITETETWHSGNTYLIQGPIAVDKGGTLTVESGANVISDMEWGASISVQGIFQAEKANFNQVGIYFSDGSNGRLDGCTLQMASSDSPPMTPTGISIYNSSPTVIGCTITGDGKGTGIYIYSGNSMSPQITNNTITGTDTAISVYAYPPSYATFSPAITGNNLTNNGCGLNVDRLTESTVVRNNTFNNTLDLSYNNGTITNSNWDVNAKTCFLSNLNLAKDTTLTWDKSDRTYQIGSLGVSQGASLTISGPKVSFIHPGGIWVQGTFQATNVNFGKMPYPGTFIGFYDGAAGRLDGCTFQMVSSDSPPMTPTGISISNSSPVVTGCTITGDRKGTGIYIYSGNSMSPQITNNTITGTDTAISVYAYPPSYATFSPTITGNNLTNNNCGLNVDRLTDSSVIKNNTFDNTLDLSYSNGTITGSNWDVKAKTCLLSNLTIAKDTTLTWDKSDRTYQIGSLGVYQGASLSISGPKVSFINPGGIWVQGTFQATNVNFGKMPYPGTFIGFYDGAAGRLDGCTFQMVSSDSPPMAPTGISVQNSSPTVTGCTIMGDGKGTGIYIYSGSTSMSPQITNNTITGTDTAISVYAYPPSYATFSPTIAGNNLANCSSYGLNYSGSGILNAPNNNWGHASGPLDNSDDRIAGGLFNPNGLGNRVNDKVNYYPWVGCTIGTTAIPAGFKATPDNGAINSNWSANGEASLGGYKLYYGTSPGSYTTPALLGKVTSHKLTGLNNNQTYYVVLSSMNTVGFESARTAELVVKPHESNTITASAGSHGSISPSGSVTVPVGTDKTFTITPDSGYHIADVRVDGESVGAVSSYKFSKVTEDHTIVASFAIDTHTITASAGSGGSISPDGEVQVNHGSSQSFTIKPDTNNNIKSVLVDGVSVGPVSSYTFKNVTENHSIAASFVVATISILTDKDRIIAPPGKTAPLQVKLSDPPQTNVTVTVAWKSGSKALSIQGVNTLTFTPANWNTYQTIQIAATPDLNDMNAAAVFELSAPGLTGTEITAVKAELGNIAPILELLLD